MMLRTSEIARGILIVGGIVYGVLCFPAINRGGREPFDPGWFAVTHVWLAPVCLSAVFEASSAPGRRRSLLMFALFTAFFNAGTFGEMTPRHVSFIGMLVATVFLYGPFHVVITFVVEGLLQFVLRRKRSRTTPGFDDPPALRSPLLAGIVGCCTIGAAVAFPIVYRSSELNAERARGVTWADSTWRDGKPVLYDDVYRIENESVHVFLRVDRETGLPFGRRSMRDIGFADAYNGRIRELIRQRGLPAGNMKADVPEVATLIALLRADDLTEVTEFPFRVTPHVGLIREGATAAEPEGVVYLETGPAGNSRNLLKRVYYKRSGNTVIVRDGNETAIVLHIDGREIAEVWGPS
jgi:hypothetical protein